MCAHTTMCNVDIISISATALICIILLTLFFQGKETLPSCSFLAALLIITAHSLFLLLGMIIIIGICNVFFF